MMSDKIPGVPDGWELVALRAPDKGEWFVGVDGKPCQAELCKGQVWPIIRKIEKPAKYRPFASAEEYLPHWGKPIRVKGSTGYDSVVSTSMIGIYVAAGETTIIRYSMADAFERFKFADGTPFGVKVQS
jgi:hypothetical protein